MKNKTIIQKAFAVLFAVIVFAGVITGQMQSNAAGDVSLTVSSATAAPGSDVVISVGISVNSGLAAATLLIKYDTTKLTYKSNVYGPAKGELNSVNANYANDGNIRTIYFAPIHTEGITVGGSMIDITFTIKTGWTGLTPLTLTTTEFVNLSYNEIQKTITNGSVSIGTTSMTTTVPATAPATTKPAAATTKPAASTTKPSVTTPTSKTPGAETTGVIPTQQATAVPVTVPVEELVEVLGPDAGNWDNNIGNLNEEQKEIIREYYSEQGQPVEITPDGVYYIETTAPETTAAESTSEDENAGGSLLNSNSKIIIAVSVVGLILAVSFGVAYYFRKKNGTP